MLIKFQDRNERYFERLDIFLRSMILSLYHCRSEISIRSNKLLFFFFGDGIIFNFSRQNWWHSDRISDSGYRWPVTNCVHKISGSRTHGTSLALIPRIIRFTEIETGVVDLIHLYNEDCAYQWQIVKKSLPPWKLKGFRSSSRSGCILDAGNNSLHLGMIEGRVEEKDLFHLNILW